MLLLDSVLRYRCVFTSNFAESVIAIVSSQIGGRRNELLPQGWVFLEEKYIFHVEGNVFAVMKLIKPKNGNFIKF